MRVAQRIQAVSVSHPVSMNRKIDQYLSENIPRLMEEFNISDRSDLSDLEDDFSGLEGRMDDLDLWKRDLEDRLMKDLKRMDRLKVKYGVK